MNIGVFANSNLCIPALLYLSQSSHQVYLTLPDQNNPEQAEIEFYANQMRFPVQRWSKQEIENNFLTWLGQHQIEAVFVMTFPFIFSKALIKKCSVPFLNVHYAPLPEYRGAQPIFWMIKNGERNGAVCIHKFAEEIDSGDILVKEEFLLNDLETFGSYSSKAAQIAVRAIHQCLEMLNKADPSLEFKSQNEQFAKLWPKPQLDDIKVNWQNMQAVDIIRLSKACNPWNKGCITSLNGREVKLLGLTKTEFKPVKGKQLGEIIKLPNNQLGVVCLSDEVLEINMIYTQEGFFSAHELAFSGLSPQECFD